MIVKYRDELHEYEVECSSPTMIADIVDVTVCPASHVYCLNGIVVDEMAECKDGDKVVATPRSAACP